jgi:hypothetical protein
VSTIRRPRKRDGRSSDGDLIHVDGNQPRLRDELVVTLPGVDPACGGDDDSVYVAIGGIVQPWCAAKDIDGVVLAAQQPVRAKARDLFAPAGRAASRCVRRQFWGRRGLRRPARWRPRSLPATSSAVPESAGSERNRNASAFSSGQAASVMTIFSLSAM